jgi:hypothetical protein
MLDFRYQIVKWNVFRLESDFSAIDRNNIINRIYLLSFLLLIGKSIHVFGY